MISKEKIEMGENGPRPSRACNTQGNFRTVGDIFSETSRLLELSASHLARLAKEGQLGTKQREILGELSRQRTRASSQLEVYCGSDASRDVTNTWMQYAQLFELTRQMEPPLAAARSQTEVLDAVRELDQRIFSALQALATRHSPPLESCENAARLVDQLRRKCTTVVATAEDL